MMWYDGECAISRERDQRWKVSMATPTGRQRLWVAHKLAMESVSGSVDAVERAHPSQEG